MGNLTIRKTERLRFGQQLRIHRARRVRRPPMVDKKSNHDFGSAMVMSTNGSGQTNRSFFCARLKRKSPRLTRASLFKMNVGGAEVICSNRPASSWSAQPMQQEPLRAAASARMDWGYR